MPTIAKITKEQILTSAFEIVKKSGMKALNNRDLAKKLNCSIRPIYYQFDNVSSLQEELIKKIEKYFFEYLLNDMDETMPEYKQIGIKYIKFAKEESNLFQILFMTKNEMSTEDFIKKNDENFEKLKKLIKNSTDLDDENLKIFHTRMWIFTHGLACLVANDICKLTDAQISQMLSYEFQALMLHEENPNNKWI